MPVGNYVDASTGTTWTELWAEDFNTDVPIGSLWDATAGGLPAGNPYHDSFTCYEPFTDTHGSCWYYTLLTTYTQASSLHIYCHVDTVWQTGEPTPLSGTFIPKLGPGYYSQFIRAQWRFRANNPDSFWGGVWQIINSEQWPGWGEFDFPEGSLDSQAEGYLHYASTTPNQTLFQPATTIMMSDWHTYTMQWEPSGVGDAHRLRVWFDSEQLLDESSGIGAGTMPKVFMFQCGTTSPWSPLSSFPASNTCDVEIDWVKVWKHPSGTA